MPGNWQMPPLQLGEDNTELEQKNLRNFKFINVFKQKVDSVQAGLGIVWQQFRASS